MQLMKERADLKQQSATTIIQSTAQQQTALQLQKRHDTDDKKISWRYYRRNIRVCKHKR